MITTKNEEEYEGDKTVNDTLRKLCGSFLSNEVRQRNKEHQQLILLANSYRLWQTFFR